MPFLYRTRRKIEENTPQSTYPQSPKQLWNKPSCKSCPDSHPLITPVAKYLCMVIIRDSVGQMLFEIAIYNLVKGTECNLSKFMYDAKLGEQSTCWKAAQPFREYDRLKKLVHRNLTQFNQKKGKYKLLHLGWNNPLYLYRHRTICIESSFEESNLLILQTAI